MLDPHAIDLDELGLALDGQDFDEVSWRINPATGEIHPHVLDVDGDETSEEHGWNHVPSAGSCDGYRDMEDCVAEVPDRRVAELLEHSSGPSSAAGHSAASRTPCPR